MLKDQTWLPRRTAEVAPDVVHHAGGVVPLRHPGRCVVTIHDLQPLDLPANFSRPKRTYLRAMLGRSARAAEVVCVPSEFTRRRVVQRLGVEANKVAVVPWSALPPSTPFLRTDRAQPPHGGLSPVSSPWATARCSSTRPSPTPTRTTWCCSRPSPLLAADVPDARLVLAGGEGPCEPDVRARLARADLAGRVQRPGRVSTAEMERLYRRATAVVVPSRYEASACPPWRPWAGACPCRGGSRVAARGGRWRRGGRARRPGRCDRLGRGHARCAATRSRRPRGGRRCRPRAGRHLTPRRTADALAGAYHRAAGGTRRPGPQSPQSPESPSPPSPPSPPIPAAHRAPMNLLILCPHYAPDVAPTGEVITAITEALAARGHRIHIVTSLPWYRLHEVEPEWKGTGVRTGCCAPRPPRGGGSPGCTRSPPTRPTSRHAPPASPGSRVRPRSPASSRSKPDVVMVMSPPLPLGVSAGGGLGAQGRAVGLQHPGRVPRRGGRARRHHQPPGDPVASWLERFLYRRSDAVTVLSDDLPRQRGRPSCTATARGRGARDPQLRRHRAHRPPRPRDRLPGAVRADGPHRGDVRRQRGHVAVARPGGLRRPPLRRRAARGGVRHQRRGLGAARVDGVGPGRGQPALHRDAAASGCPRCWPPATST